jgi:DNA-binding response OmpR family regulator
VADILIVDDDPDYGASFVEILACEGHVVRLANNGAEGLRLLRARMPELVLLDVDMPILSGPEMALQMLIEDVGKERIPILFISANPDLSAIAKRIGTAYFLAKPFDLRVVLVLIDRVLSERIAPTWPGP